MIDHEPPTPDLCASCRARIVTDQSLLRTLIYTQLMHGADAEEVMLRRWIEAMHEDDHRQEEQT